MASSVFFKFKSQKEPTRVEFDGTGISVFELKREIILRSGLGDGNDFDLVICADEGMKEPYDDDTVIIPRSTTVIARRMPPKITGRGGAARYVSGKMPVHAKNSSRREQNSKPLIKAPAASMVQLNSSMTEEEKMAAVFQAQTENFTAREEEMATQQYVAKGGPKKPTNVPDHEPPQGYICYRCGEKGHWIQLCPTNDNPEYDNRPRVKRTTGIPKSFLKTVDKATVLSHTDGDDSKTPSGIMVNPDGEWVIAEPDKASWEQFQAKAKSNASAQKATLEGDKEVQERGLECPIDKKMFIDPMKTPCCEKTYCNDCITNALIESDFICPGCKSDGVLIDDLKPDSEAVDKMKAFLAEKDSKAKASSSPKSPVAAKSPAAGNGDANITKGGAAKAKSKSPSPGTSQPSQTTASTTSASHNASSTPANGDNQGANKKRLADESLENPKIPKAPKAMQQQHQDVQQQQQAMMAQMMAGGMNGMPMMNPMTGMPMMYPGMPMMPNFGGMPMPNMNMGMGMMNPMMGNGMGGYGMNGFQGGMQGNANGMWAGPGAGQGMGMNNAGVGAGVGQNMNMAPRMNGNNGGYNPQLQQQGPGFKNFSHQPADEEDAYFRKPVNPHRHQNRQRRARPSDYREL
ncbi:DWNN domain-containing protein [Cercophora newfieldiana]|uniref:DWNN domain-containing protein n=1 Tax=Cercophora newfieldiana TaxID=92897 RepID=A0AA40CX15_9PEZI|nr:DWNN domain-containing protein [Cercophora newfieldiana]